MQVTSDLASEGWAGESFQHHTMLFDLGEDGRVAACPVMGARILH